MYPLRLYLKNFLSYGEKGIEIDFSIYHTLLLLGPNGAGKSSILDAILWGIWGKTRFGGDTDIMHTGSTDMEVRIDLMVKNSPYRIIRKRSKKGKSFVSVLEFQSLTEPITLLTDATIIKTQEKINEVLGISYEILISSAFLRQGDAQEFTQKSPSKRKELLASLLHLDQYQIWHEESKKQQRELENALLSSNSQKQYLEQEKARLAHDITAAQAQIDSSNEAEVQEKIGHYQQQIQSYEQVLQSQKERLEQIAFYTKALQQAKGKTQSIQTQVLQLKNELEKAIAHIGAAPIAVAAETLATITQQFEQLQRAQLEKEGIQQKIDQLKKETQAQEQQHAVQSEKVKQEIIALHNNPLLKKYVETELVEKLQQSQQAQILIESQQQKLIDLSTQIGGFDQELQFTIQQGNQIKDKRTKLETLGDACPLCEQKVNEHHKGEIAHKYDDERAQLLTHYNQLKEKRDLLVTEKDKLNENIKVLREESNLALELQKTQNLYLQLRQLEQRQQEIEITFANQTQELHEANAKLEIELQQAISKSSEWETVKQQKEALQLQDQQYRAYQEHAIQIKSLEREIQLLEASLQTNKEDEQKIQSQIDQLQSQSIDATIDQQLQQLRTELKNAQAIADKLKEQKNLLAHLEQEQVRITQSIENIVVQTQNLEIDRQAYSVLVDAFGYRGIPTMIIEDAIPRLEQYANDILSFLSDNTMSIRFSLSRTSKVDKDNQIETLDILIGDTFGTRAYELFSGGEAFRIDIALRLALTKLLTERSKGNVEFLVIDEGFGSQDENGQDHIVQIIHKLEKYFKLIVIITHVAQLKETFSDRLIIRKGAQGSEVVQDLED